MGHSNKVSVLLASITLVLANGHKNFINSPVTYRPNKGWINDPNGLVRVDGSYHLFYQYSPDSDTPQNLCWGHAISNDLVNWQDKGVALPYNPATKEQRYTGSAVYDRNNSSGLGKNGSPVVAIYTSNYAENSTFPDGSPVTAGTQCQSLAFSQDRGVTWQTYHENPVIRYPPPQYAQHFNDFRDPKVFWYKPQNKWVMVVSLPTLRKALLYSSSNLKNWTYMSEFSSKNAPVHAIWECPDLYRIEVFQQNESKWILSVSMQSEANLDGMYYFIGHFDGIKFVEDENKIGAFKRLDFGSDFYAGATWNNVGTRRLQIGWVNNVDYATKITKKYRGTLSTVRELGIIKKGNEYKLIQKPIENVYNYVKWVHNYTKAGVENGIEMNKDNSYNFIVNILSKDATETSFSLVVEDELRNEEAKIHYDYGNKTISIEKLNMDPNAHNRVMHSAKFDPGLEIILNIFVDANTLTVFCNYGELVFTELLVTDSKIRMLRLHKGSTAEVRVTEFWLAKF